MPLINLSLIRFCFVKKQEFILLINLSLIRFCFVKKQELMLLLNLSLIRCCFVKKHDLSRGDFIMDLIIGWAKYPISTVLDVQIAIIKRQIPCLSKLTRHNFQRIPEKTMGLIKIINEKHPPK